MRGFDRAQCIVKKSIELLDVHEDCIGVVESYDVKMGMRVGDD